MQDTKGSKRIHFILATLPLSREQQWCHVFPKPEATPDVCHAARTMRPHGESARPRQEGDWASVIPHAGKKLQGRGEEIAGGGK